MGKANIFLPEGGLRIDYAKLRSFLEEFDAVQERYGYKATKEDCENCDECDGEDHCICCVNGDLSEVRAALAHQSRVPFQNEYAPENHKNMMDNLRLVYGEDEPSLEEFPYIYTLVRDKILDRYVGVKGLARLFNDHFWYLELPMMLELDDEKGEHRHNRDHFLHQVKNACEIHALLRDMNLIHHTKSVLDRSESSAAAYFHGSVSRSYDYMRNHRAQEDIYLNAFWDDEKLIDKSEKDKTDEEKAQEECFEKNVKNSLREYIIMGSLLTAALFHDIGYPVEFAMRQAEKLKKHSSMITFFLDYRGDYDNIASLLEDSLLFRIVPPKVIREKLEKKDHGTLSALLFLLYFYRTGIINTLPPDQEAVIELAGLAIFDHTLKYESIDGNKHDDLHYRPTFYRNPVSFMLRLCDDIQEWDRFKFKLEPKERIAIHVCSTCKMPVLPMALEQTDTMDAVAGKERLRGQRCRCGDLAELTLIRPERILAERVQNSDSEHREYQNDLSEFRQREREGLPLTDNTIKEWLQQKVATSKTSWMNFEEKLRETLQSGEVQTVHEKLETLLASQKQKLTQAWSADINNPHPCGLLADKAWLEKKRAMERDFQRELSMLLHGFVDTDLLPRLQAANGTLLRIMNSGHREAEKIQPCDSILFRNLDPGRHLKQKTRHGHIELEFELNAYDLLYLSTYDPEAVCFTADEMVKIRKNMAGQSEFPLFELRNQITNNPIDLKVQLIERYLMQLWGMTRKQICEEIMRYGATTLIARAEEAVQALVKRTYRPGNLGSLGDIYFISQRVKEYIHLLFCCWDMENSDEKKDISEEKYKKEYEEADPTDRPLLAGIKSDKATCLLIKNCLAVRAPIASKKRDFVFYKAGGMDKESMLYWVKEYTDMRNYSYEPNLPLRLDMYPDVYLFYVLRELSKRFVMP